jgi:hypothetical protein
MSAITPVTSMPANGVSPSGMLTSALPQIRLQAVTASGGSRLTLIQKSEGGDWFKVPAARVLSGSRLGESKAVLDLATGEAGEVIISNNFGSTAYHVLEENGGVSGNENGTATAYIAGASAPVTTGDLSVSNVTASGALSVGTTSTLTGAATLSSTLAVAGASTLTGLLTANGDILLGAAKVLGFGAPQALSGAGACNVTTISTLFTSTGSAQALTLADGTRAGQLKFISHVVDGGSGVLTPTTKTGFSTVTFTNVNDWACLIWSGSAWFVLAYSGATIA